MTQLLTKLLDQQTRLSNTDIKKHQTKTSWKDEISKYSEFLNDKHRIKTYLGSLVTKLLLKKGQRTLGPTYHNVPLRWYWRSSTLKYQHKKPWSVVLKNDYSEIIIIIIIIVISLFVVDKIVK